MNRLEDSFYLWKSIVANRLLANVNVVLFLNKCDLLQRKLAAGTRIRQYMLSYGDRPNDYEAVSKCAWRLFREGCVGSLVRTDFRNKFSAVHQTYSPNKDRELFSTYASGCGMNHHSPCCRRAPQSTSRL